MAGPWEKYAGQSAPQSGPPAFIPGTPNPAKQAQEGRAAAGEQRAQQDQQMQRERFDWERQRAAKQDEKDSGQAYSQSALDAFDRAIATAGRLKKHPGFYAGVGMPSINPLDGNLASFIVPGSKAADFRAELDALKAQVFLPMVQSMKGMGALSNAEGQKLTDAIGALDPRMSEGGFGASLDRIIGDLKTYRDRGAKPSVKPSGQTARPATAKRLRYNPATGALE